MIRALTILFLFTSSAIAAEPAAKPNIVFILADDLGYGDVSCFGQSKYQSPNIDRLAKGGMKFTQFYAGSTVCAPSRCSLMTGYHCGHALIRGNGRQNLGPNDRTVAEVLKAAGYRTGLFGKWGLGEENTSGTPMKKGFDAYFGYLNQNHAHNYYPDFLIKGEMRFALSENKQSKVNGVAENAATFAPDAIAKESLDWLTATVTEKKPFFLFFASTLPHANNERTKATGNGNEVPPGYSPFAKENWPQAEKDKAAMTLRLDENVGMLMKKLKELGVDQNTLVIFSSDNGPHKEGGNDPEFFKSAGPFRGIKRSLTDGGIRVPTIAHWPTAIKPGTTSEVITAFWDFLPTAAELAGAQTPNDLDGLSLVPTLTGKGEQKRHDFLYWEFHEGGSKQAVRHGNWKGIRQTPTAKWELYDLIADAHEDKNIAALHPDVVAQIEADAKAARSPSDAWPLLEPKKK